VIGVTQRVVDVPGRERRDVLDQAWTPFLAECGFEMVPVPNRHEDPAGYLRRLGASGVVLSGGGNISASIGTRSGQLPRLASQTSDLAPERDIAETAILQASITEGWPVIGVCRGMQAMNLFHGGSIARIDGHAGTGHALAIEASPLSFKLDFTVNSYHDFGIPMDALGDGLEPAATADDCVEAFVHSQLPHLGIMWHPERNQPASRNDVELFSKFLRGRR
jgi:N5-(cytidine 5'-diphosphoramidyl)-L-glutamine hydrolase